MPKKSGQNASARKAGLGTHGIIQNTRMHAHAHTRVHTHTHCDVCAAFCPQEHGHWSPHRYSSRPHGVPVPGRLGPGDATPRAPLPTHPLPPGPRPLAPALTAFPPAAKQGHSRLLLSHLPPKTEQIRTTRNLVSASDAASLPRNLNLFSC